MGLDTYASNTCGEVGLTREQRRAFEAAALPLTGGMYSGEPGSFRGKMYEIVIPEVADVSLYQEWIPPETVESIRDALRAQDYDAAQDLVLGRVKDGREIADLLCFLDICVEHGLGLINWW